jgi:hypothetical protein
VKLLNVEWALSLPPGCPESIRCRSPSERMLARSAPPWNDERNANGMESSEMNEAIVLDERRAQNDNIDRETS